MKTCKISDFKPIVLVFISLIFISCGTSNHSTLVSFDVKIKNLKESTNWKNWHFKDIEQDSIPGISLERANHFINAASKPESVLVAVIDTETDINHDFLKTKIWINNDEIPNNGKDDDNNGYIDDLNGWNFLGNAAGENNKYVNFESTRILRKLATYFQTKDTLLLDENDANLFIYLKKVQERQKQRTIYFLDNQDNYDRLFTYYHEAIRAFKPYFTIKTATLTKLDSLQQAGNTGISDFNFLVIKDCLESNIDDIFVLEKKMHATNLVEKLLNVNYNDRQIQGDNPYDLTDIAYGNNLMSNNVTLLDHGTNMSGIIVGIAQQNEIQIMPLAISCYGDEHDKDIALAIRYAVNNGAKIINMSFGKEFSSNNDWVLNAIKYAALKDVLLISSAGNNSLELDSFNEYYPNDNDDNHIEISDNFILVGASAYLTDITLKESSSNYGRRDVDLFAPGTDIYTTAPNNTYINNANGTSSAAAITSGVAALIRSYYPALTASQVKHILMDSGVEYTIDVATPTKENPDKTTPFNQLSKSGKILNAYNALLMAEQINKGR